MKVASTFVFNAERMSLEWSNYVQWFSMAVSFNKAPKQIQHTARIVNELRGHKGKMNSIALWLFPSVIIHQQVQPGLHKLQPEISPLYSEPPGWTEQLIHWACLTPGHIGGPLSPPQVPGSLRELWLEHHHWKGDANTTPSLNLTSETETHTN